MPTAAEAMYPEGPKDELGNGAKPGIWETILGLVWGGRKAEAKPTRAGPRDFPELEDVRRSEKSDLTYGSRMAPHLVEGAMAPTATGLSDIKAFMNAGAMGEPRKTSEAQRSLMHAQWLAVRNSPVAELGWDPDKMMQFISPGKYYEQTPKGGQFLGGAARADTGTAWSDIKDRTSAVHESMHKGIYQLREAKLWKGHRDDDENLVRALMLRHLGDVEEGGGVGRQPQVQAARKWLENEDNQKKLDELEAAAAQQIAKRRPRGPR